MNTFGIAESPAFTRLSWKAKPFEAIKMCNTHLNTIYNLLNFPSLNFIKKYKDYINKINEIKNYLKNNKFIINDDNLILLQDLYIIEIIDNDIYIIIIY